jgi:hypothetical protein
MTFEEAKAQVEEDCRQAKAVEKAQQIVNEIHSAARRPWSGQPRDEQGFTEPPDTEKVEPFAQLRDRYAAQYPVKYGQTGLLDQTAFASAPDGLPAAAYGARQQRMFTSQMAFRVKGLHTPVKDDPAPVLNLYEPSPVMVQSRMDANRQQAPYKAFIFRVIAVKPAGPPASIDEVRAKVIENLKVLAAFSRAETYARAIAERTHEVGMEMAVAEQPEILNLYTGVATQPSAPAATQPTAEIERAIKLMQPFIPPGGFRRTPGRVMDVPRSTKLHEEIFRLADAPFSSTMPAHRLVVVPAARDRKWIVAELLDVKPLYEAEYEQARDQRLQQTGSQVVRTFTSAWFDPSNVFQRTGFVPAQPPVE